MRLAAVVTLSAVLLAPLGAVQDADVRLQKAIQQEVTSGDLKAAVAEYRRIAEDGGSPRDVRARALLRMAHAHRKLGDAQAQKIYAQVIADFGDQPGAVAEAKSQLARGATVAAAANRQARQLWVDADTTGTVSFDGSILSYTDWESGDLAIRDLAYGTSRRLTRSAGWQVTGEFAEFSVPSRDGKQVAYSWFVDKPAVSYQLRVIDTGAEPKARILAKGTSPAWIRPQAWTPDGRHLVVLRVEGSEREFLMVDVATGTRRSIRKHVGQVPSSIRISPDGRYIAYAFLTNEQPRQREIAILSVDGKSEPVVLSHPAEESEVEWSPDGSSVLFVSNRTGARALWSMNVTEGRPSGSAQLLSTDVGRSVVGITRQGALLYAVGGARRNVTIATLGSDGRFTGDATAASKHFVDSTTGGVWSPDGNQLAYYAVRGSTQGPGSRVIVVKTPAVDDERPIEPRLQIPEGAGIALRWFPDGRSFLVVARGREGTLDYYRVDRDTAESHLLFSPEGGGPATNDPQLGPDGRSVYFVAGNSRALTRYDLTTKQKTELRKGWFSAISLSPDGQSLAYLGNFEGASDKPMHIGIIPVAGGEPVEVLNFPWTGAVSQNALGWSHDGRHILFVRPEAEGQSHAIWRVPVTGGEAPASTGIVPGGNIKRPSMHPDGKRLVFSHQQQVPTELWILENFLASARR